MQGNKLKRNYIQGWLNNVDMITTHGAKEVVVGVVPVNSAPAMVLFDPSASHSFISRECVEDHKITMLPMRKPVIVKSLGREIKADRICPNVSLDVNRVNFEANLIALELMDIDGVLRMGWLYGCKGVIKYAQCLELLITPSGERIEYEGIQPAPEEDENDLLEGVSCEDKKNGL